MNNRTVFIVVAIGLALFLLAFGFFFLGGGAPNAVVEIDTNMGKIKVQLFGDQAPVTVNNFLKYVEAKHYDGTIFHRVLANFMIQGGGLDENMTPRLREDKSTRGIRNESSNGVKNERGTIAMARTGEPDSATDQFFINVVDNRFLDRDKAEDGVGYCVFGKVIGGMKVVDEIRRVEVVKRPQDREAAFPIEPVIINSIRRVDQ